MEYKDVRKRMYEDNGTSLVDTGKSRSCRLRSTENGTEPREVLKLMLHRSMAVEVDSLKRLREVLGNIPNHRLGSFEESTPSTPHSPLQFVRGSSRWALLTARGTEEPHRIELCTLIYERIR